MASEDHRIVAVTFVRSRSCLKCDAWHPHNVVVKCACGATATGRDPHIWSVTGRDECGASITVSLRPSFDWQGHPVHEYLVKVPLVMHAELEAVA